MANSRDIMNIKMEIAKLEANALEQFEQKRVPNRNNHNRLQALKKQLSRMLQEMER